MKKSNGIIKSRRDRCFVIQKLMVSMQQGGKKYLKKNTKTTFKAKTKDILNEPVIAVLKTHRYFVRAISGFEGTRKQAEKALRWFGISEISKDIIEK